MKKPSIYKILYLTAILCLTYACKNQHSMEQPKRPWKGFAIIGNGQMSAVYSDDKRVKSTGIQHFYFENYTMSYIKSTHFDLLENSYVLKSVNEEVTNADFFSTLTKIDYKNMASEVKCFALPEKAIVLSSQVTGVNINTMQKFEMQLVNKSITNKETSLKSLRVENGKAIAEWSNNTVLIVACKSPGFIIGTNDSIITISGKASSNLEVIISPAKSISEGIINVGNVLLMSNLYAVSNNYWNDWINKGVIPNFPDSLKQYTNLFKSNLYCVKATLLNGQVPADITGQFVTNNMPQLYPRDEMMIARVLFLTGHASEAKEIIRYWANKTIPQKSKGEWYARYDAYANAVDSGSGARYDEPEWDANGYYIQLLDMYHKQHNEWLADKKFIYELADFLVNKIDKNGLLYEGGIVEWTGYLPATNMTCSAGLLTASKIAESFGDKEKAKTYKKVSETISSNLHFMVNKKTNAYADVRYTATKGANKESLSKETTDTTYLWDTSTNFGVIWGYPNHKDVEETNIYYQKTCFKQNGGVQYFDAKEQFLNDYGHACFFFTTAASAQYNALYGNPVVAKQNIEWMVRNANMYGLMSEAINLDESNCHDATPLSWCSAEFAASLVYYSKTYK